MEWFIYLIGMCDNIRGSVELLIVMFALCFILVGLAFMAEDSRYHVEECLTNAGRRTKRLMKYIVICTIIYSLTPSSQTAAAMYLVPKITSNENFQNVPSKALKVLNSKLDEWVTSNTDD